MTSPRSSIVVSPLLLPAWGFGAAPAHPRDPKSDRPLASAGKTTLPLAEALREGRAPSLASLNPNGYFLTPYFYSITKNIIHVTTGPQTPPGAL